MYIAKIMKHRWEEEPISGIGKGFDGTFAIFFYGCNLRCVYCQNYKISRTTPKLIKEKGKFDKKVYYTFDELSDEIIKAQNENVASVSFITGVLYINEIVETIKLAKEKGLRIPVVYNSSGYELVSNIKKLDGLVDIYLPDFKYFSNELSKKYSGVSNYVEIAKLCIDEMYRQIKTNKSEGSKQLIVRHLVLPGNTENSKQVIKYLYDTYKDDITISIMSQYTPICQNEDIKPFSELNRRLTKREYEKVVNYAIDIGVKNALIQEENVAFESFIPDFK